MYYFYSKKNVFSLLLLFSVLIIGIYHIVLYLLRKDPSLICFALICILLSVRLLFFGDHFLYEYIKNYYEVSYSIQSKIYYITTFSLLSVGLWYVRCLYPNDVSLLIVRLSTILIVVYSLFILLFPPRVFITTIPPFQIVTIATFLYMLYIFIRIASCKRPEWKEQSIGVGLMIFASLHDILASKGLIKFLEFVEFLPISLELFVFIQFYILAKRLSNAFSEVEQLSSSLEVKVKERTRQVVEQSEEIEDKNNKLEKAFSSIKSSVQYASRLQKTIIGNESSIEDTLHDSFILYLPKDIVSGDFYWFSDNIDSKPGIKILIARRLHRAWNTRSTYDYSS